MTQHELKIIKKEERDRSEALVLAQNTAKLLKDIQSKFEGAETTSKEYFDSLSEVINSAMVKLVESAIKKPEINVDVSAFESIIKESFEQFAQTLSDVKDLVSAMELPAPVIHNEVKTKDPIVNIDMTDIETLLRSELPEIFNLLIGSIPTTMTADMSELNKMFAEMMELLKKVLEKKAPMFVQGGGGGGYTPNAPFQGGNAVPVITGGIVPERWDDLALDYTGANLTQVTYYWRGDVAATVNLEYVSNKLTRVTRV